MEPGPFLRLGGKRHDCSKGLWPPHLEGNREIRVGTIVIVDLRALASCNYGGCR
jgi:hypothetical protein